MRGRRRRRPAAHGRIDRLALAALHAGLLGWAVAPDWRPAGAVLLLSSLLNLWRLWRWRGPATVGEPLLAVLHLGYAWLALGAGLLGTATLSPAVPLGAAMHALTVGAAGTMILAVMTRATRGHTGHALTADAATQAIYVIATLAALTRIVAAFAGGWMLPALLVAAVLWISAFALFVARYAPMLLQRRRPA